MDAASDTGNITNVCVFHRAFCDILWSSNTIHVLTVLVETAAESGKGEWNPVSKHQNKRADAGRDGRT